MVRALIGSLALWCAFAGAARAQTRTVVMDFEGGRESSQMRSLVVDALEDKAVEVVSTKTATAQAKRSGAELDSESGRVRVGKKLHLTSYVEGRTERGRKGTMKLNITVYSARDGLNAGQWSISLPKKKLITAIKDQLWTELGAAIRGETDTGGGGAAAAEPEEPVAAAPTQQQRQQIWQQQQQAQQPPPRTQRRPPPPQEEGEEQLAQAEPQEEEPGEEVPADESGASRPPSAAGRALDLNIGARFGTRNFAYNDPLPGLRKYDMSLSPNLRLAIRWYPVAHFDDKNSIASNIGLDLRGEMLVGVTSKNRAGQKFETNAHSIGVGVRGRLPFRTAELGAVLGYGLHAFSLDGTSKATPDVPNASYGFLRAGLDARWTFYDPLYFGIAGAFLLAVSHGQIEDKTWFPHTSGNGVEAEFAFGWSISHMIGFEAAISLQRYFMSFDPLPNDPGVRDSGRVAGGAVDQYVSGRVAMVIRL